MVEIAYRFNKQALFPSLDRALRHWQRVFKKKHNGIGPDGMMDDVYQWIMELVKHYNETGDVLTHHYVPNLTSHSLVAKEYERMFLQIALSLLRKFPGTLSDIRHVSTVGDYLVLLFTYDETQEDQPLLDIWDLPDWNEFVRPNKVPRNHPV